MREKKKDFVLKMHICLVNTINIERSINYVCPKI